MAGNIAGGWKQKLKTPAGWAGAGDSVRDGERIWSQLDAAYYHESFSHGEDRRTILR